MMMRIVCVILVLSGTAAADPILTVPTRLDPLVQSADMIDPQWRLEPAHDVFRLREDNLISAAIIDPVTPVPEPASLLLVGSGLGMLARRIRRK